MNLLNKLTIKNLKLNKKRTVMTVIGIILSVALLTAVANMFFSAKASMIVYQKQEQGNYHYGFEGVSKEDLQKLEQNRHIEQIYVTSILGYAKLEGAENEYKPYAYIKEYSQDALLNMCVNLTDGRYPESANEIVIPTHLKNNGGLNYKVGDIITLEVGERVSEGEPLNQDNPYHPEIPEEIINTQTKKYNVVGIMERFPYRLESYEAPGYTFITYLEEQESVTNADVYVRYTKEALKEQYRVTADILGVDADAFEAIHGGSAWTLDAEEFEVLQVKINNPKFNSICNDYLISLETGVFANSTLNALMMAAGIVVLIIIATSVFCIKNSFDISITEKIRQYGMLASIGATSKQIKKNVYYEATILGFMGIPLGILSGTFAAFILMKVSDVLLEDALKFDLIYSFSWMAVIFSVVLGFITIFLSAKRSAKRASKITPIQAIRSSEEVKINRKEMKSPKWVKKVFGIGGEVSYKNLQRSKRKYQATVISIVMCVSVFIALTSFVNAAFGIVRAEFGDIRYKLQLSYVGEKEIYDMADEIQTMEKVEYAVALGRGHLQFDTTPDFYTEDYLEYMPNYGQEWVDENGEKHKWQDGINVYVLDKASFQEYVKALHLDYQAVKDKGILLNNVIFYVNEKQLEIEMYTFQKGDSIIGEVGRWDEQAQTTVYKPLEVEIAKLAEEVPVGVSDQTSSAGLIVCAEYFKEIIDYQNQKNIYINAEDTEKVQNEIETIMKTALDEGETFHIYNVEENEKEMRSFYTLVSIFLYGFITVIALIGVTNIFNTISTNMNLRRREFAMLRSIGMTKREFNRMILLESFFYGMKSLVIGIPIGVALSLVIHDVMMGGEWVLSYQLPLQAILLSVAAVFILITVIMKYSLGKINQQNTIETIRNENI